MVNKEPIGKKRNREFTEAQYSRKKSMETDNSSFQKYSKDGRTGGCFAFETPVLTPNGWKRIDQIEIGSLVLSMNSGNRIVERKVLQTKYHKGNRIWEVSTSNFSTPIRTTWCHSFQTSKGIKLTALLSDQDRFTAVNEAGSLFENEVLRVDRTEKFEDVVNLITEADFNFIVQGAIVESFSFFCNLRKGAWRYKSSSHRDLQPAPNQ